MRILFFYEPKQVPVLDSDGNIVEYKNSIALPATLEDSDSLRIKTSCAERGLSACKENAVGFRKLLDTISQNRTLMSVSFQQIGNDDLSVMSATMKGIEIESSSKKK